MAIRKRTRFEVLRRDGFKCRYCGLAGPEGAGLTIDHVVPVSLGGNDDPSNLVAACKDCNAGKASSNPDAPLVAQVSDDAVRWAAAMRGAAETQLLAKGERDAYRQRFLKEWQCWDEKLEWLDSEWVASLGQFQRSGLPVELLVESIDIAWGNRRIPVRSTFRYLCGIAWNQITEMQKVAKANLSSSQPTSAEPLSNCILCWWVEDDEEDPSQCPYLLGDLPEDLDWCGSPQCSVCHAKFHGHEEGLPEGYNAGFDAGERRGSEAAQDHGQTDLMPGTLLRAVVDGSTRRRFGDSFIAHIPDMDLPLVIRQAPSDPWAVPHGA